MFFKILSLIFLLLLDRTISYEWSFGFYNPISYSLTDVDFDAAGNVIVLGGFRSSNNATIYNVLKQHEYIVPRPFSINGNQMTIQKFSPHGILLSTLSYDMPSGGVGAGGLAVDTESSIVHTSKFNSEVRVYLNSDTTPFGFVQSPSSSFSCFLMKISRANVFSWSTTISAADNSNVESCLTTVDKRDNSILLSAQVPANVDITVTSRNDAPIVFRSVTSQGSILVKYSTNGNVQWVRVLSLSGLFGTNSLDTDEHGNVLWVGYTIGHSTLYALEQQRLVSLRTFNYSMNKDAFVIKLSQEGHLLWIAGVSGDNYEGATSVAVDSQNNIYVAGPYYSNNSMIWSANYSSSTPISRTFRAPQYEVILNWGGFLVKYSPNGNIIWTSNHSFWMWGVPKLFLSVNSYNNDVALHLFNGGNEHTVTDAFGKILVTYNTFAGDCFLLQYFPNGNLTSLTRIASNNGHDDLSRIIFNRFGVMVYIGWSFGTELKFSDNEILTRRMGSIFGFLRLVNPTIAYTDFFHVTGNQICFSNITEGKIDVLSNEVPRLTKQFPYSVNKSQHNVTIVSACSQSICFVAINGKQIESFYRHPFYIGIYDTNTEAVSTLCSVFTSSLGFHDWSGDLSDGTFSFELRNQYGFRTTIPFSNIGNRQSLSISFNLTVVEEKFTLGFETVQESIEIEFTPYSVTLSRVGSNQSVAIPQVINSVFLIHLNSSIIQLFRNGTEPEILFNQGTLLNSTIQRVFVFTQQKSVVRNMLDVQQVQALKTSSSSLLPELTATETIPLESEGISTFDMTKESETHTNEINEIEPLVKMSWATFVLIGVWAVLTVVGAVLIVIAIKRRRDKKMRKNTTLNGTIFSNTTYTGTSSIQNHHNLNYTLVNSTFTPQFGNETNFRRYSYNNATQ